MTAYLGYPVLDKLHNRRGPMPEKIARGIRSLDPGTTKRFSDQVGKAAKPARPFLWSCGTFAEIATMREFLEAQQGRALPFWLPSLQQDLTLTQDLAQSASSITVNWIGYSTLLYGTSGSRRHLALYAVGGGAMFFTKVTGATDPNDLVTESLALGTPAPRLFPKASTIVSFLKLCRLEEDAVRIRFLSSGVAECEFMAREIPMEAAA